MSMTAFTESFLLTPKPTTRVTDNVRAFHHHGRCISSSPCSASPKDDIEQEGQRRRRQAGQRSTRDYKTEGGALFPDSPTSNTRIWSSSSLQGSSTDTSETTRALVGDDAAYFSLSDQKLQEWIYFTIATGSVLAFVAWFWFLPFGLHGGDAFLQLIQTNMIGSTDPATTSFAMLCIFAVAHSGLAGLRTYAEPVVGPRAWRVLFALVSLPLALSCISYFVNHAHEGVQLWQLVDPAGDPSVATAWHAALWMVNFISFLFLYPSSFNLLEIAAIQTPQLHLWETGIIRITRHPQAVGQLLWCLAHTAWLGTSTAVATSSVLIAHHVFATYHGDRRLAYRHGADFDYIKSKTSIFPFQAIWEGRQELPVDYWKEFVRGPYLVVVAGTIGAYLAHPYMQAGAALLHW
ncbi:hypothetical protein ACA910_010956 [Epithemia clementina (nom. ined.)]